MVKWFFAQKMFPQLVQSWMWASAEPELLTVRVHLDLSEFTLNSWKGLPRSREKSCGAQGIQTYKLNANGAASPSGQSMTNAILIANNFFFFIETYNLQGGPLVLPPLSSLCARMENTNRVLNWPPSEMTESRACHPKNWQSPEL